MPGLAEALRVCPVIAIIRASNTRWVPDTLATLADHGLRAVEVALTTPDALAAIRTTTRAGLSTLTLGAGTVLDAEAARAAVGAGARYLVTPAVLPEVISAGIELGVPVVAGALTPTEVLMAWRAGATMIKVFPADAAGGPAYLQALLGPLPEIPLVPTGGVRIDNVAAYLRAGAVAVGMGGPLVGDAANGGDLTALARRAAALVSELAAAKPPGGTAAKPPGHTAAKPPADTAAKPPGADAARGGPHA